MQLFSVNVPESYELILWGDNQEGNVATSHSSIKELVDYILEAPNRYCIHMGDAIEAFWIEDKRYQKDTCLAPPLEQMSNFKKMICPLCQEGRMLCMLMGNHELRWVKNAGNVTSFICDELQKEVNNIYPLYGTYSAKLELSDKKGLQFKIYVTHGSKSINSTSPDPGRRRAYMEFILQRHLENKFADTMVMAKGHCLSEDTELCTKEGWKRYDEILLNEEILTFNMGEEKSEWQKVDQYFIYENKYNEMFVCKNRKTDFMITSDHKMVLKTNRDPNKNRSPKRKYDLPKGIYPKGKKYAVQVTRNNKKVNIDHDTFNTIEEAVECYNRTIAENPIPKEKWKFVSASDAFSNKIAVIPISAFSKKEDFPITDDWISLIGWLIAEGSFRDNGSVLLSQRESNAYKIRDLLTRMGIPFSKWISNDEGRIFIDPNGGIYTTKENQVIFYVKIKDAKIIRQFITGKYIPDFAFEFSDRQFEVFLEAVIDGDGTWQKNSKKSAGYLFSSDIKMLDKFQALCVSHGFACYIKPKKRGFAAGFIKNQTLRINTNNNCNKVKATKIAWCVSVGNQTIFTRRNGKVSVLGNTHKLLVKKPLPSLYLTTNKGKIYQNYTKPGTGTKDLYIPVDNRFFCSTGSFLKTYQIGVSTYSEIAEYDPVELGYVKIIVRDREIFDVQEIKV